MRFLLRSRPLGASYGRREKRDEKQRTCSETNEMPAHPRV